MPLQIIRNDITKMQVDAIVTSANPRPIVDGGVDRRIHTGAGRELLAAREEIGDIAAGQAAITPAYRLHARYVIHTVGPVWQDGTKGERELLDRCYQNALRLAADHDCRSVAFPLISSGVFGCPAEIAIAAAVRAIREFLRAHEMDVYLVVFDRNAFRISRSLFDDVQDYLDAMYVEEMPEEEERGEYHARRRRALEAPVFLGDEAPEPAAVVKECCAIEAPRCLEEALEETDETFSEALLRLIDASGRTDAEVYKRANVDRKHFSKIRNNPDYQPSKTTALAFAVALELSLEETKAFIGRAGFAISHSNKADIIVEYFIRRSEYDIFSINETLFAFGQPCLGA